MRFKNRYLLLQLRFESEADRRKVYSTLNERSLNQEIKNSILALHGNYGLACVLHSLHVKYLNVTTDVAVLRAPRARYREVWSAITTMTSVNKTKCSINVIYIGGTIKCCQKKLIEYNYKKLKDMATATTSAVEKRNIVTKIKEVIAKDSSLTLYN